tara:strand:+ start:387 stop:512 length:126 start_codon:yes stop_codon:yes gene_type:complete
VLFLVDPATLLRAAVAEAQPAEAEVEAQPAVAVAAEDQALR